MGVFQPIKPNPPPSMPAPPPQMQSSSNVIVVDTGRLKDLTSVPIDGMSHSLLLINTVDTMLKIITVGRLNHYLQIII